LFYKDNRSKVRATGVLAKIIGISKSEIKLTSLMQQYSNLVYVTVYIVGRIKLNNYEKINEIYTNLDILEAKVEFLEDEISNYYLFNLSFN